MLNCKPAVFLSFALSLAAAGAESVAADGHTTCLREVARADLEAKTAYQEGLRNLIVARQPDFNELADINLDLQVLFAEMRFDRLSYLLATAPARVDGANGLSRFRNFDWTEEDLENLKTTQPEYTAKLARLEALKGRNQGHPDWPEMRAFVKSEMSGGGPLAELTATFMEHNAGMEARLADCREN